jgi:hypothetical protein
MPSLLNKQPGKNQPFGFAPPSREPSSGALFALMALVLGFAIALALYAAFNASTHTDAHPPAIAGISQ